MIDSEITFQADELSYEDYEKMSDFRKHVQKISTTI